MPTIKIEVTAEELKNVNTCLDDLFTALPKSKQGEYLYELNELGLFIGKARIGLKEALQEEVAGE